MTHIDLAAIYLQDIKNFLMAADSLNFSFVARECDVSPSAISKSISRLENATSLILFVRHMGKLKLTPAGKRLADKLKNYIIDCESAVAEAHVIQEGKNKRLSIGLPNEHDLPWMVHCVTELKKSFQNIEISVGIYDFGVLKSKLKDGSLDIIFTIYFEKEGFRNTDIEWKFIEQMPLCVFVPEANPLSKKEKVTIADLQTEKFVVHSPSMVPGYLKLLNDLCRPYGFTPLISKYSDNVGSFVMDLVFGENILIGDELLKQNFPDSVRCFPLEGTISGRILAWDVTRENEIIREFIRICSRKE